MRFYSKNESNAIVAVWSLDPMPGCPRVGISHGFEVFPEYQNQGYGKKSYQERIKKAKELGYTTLLATVVCGNVREEKILSRNKWISISRLYNPQTGNDVTLWKKDLDPNVTYEDLYGA